MQAEHMARLLEAVETLRAAVALQHKPIEAPSPWWRFWRRA
jgi:hypothetical protein